MTQENIQNNKLIAEFMGFVCDDLKERDPLERRFHGTTKEGKHYQFPKTFYCYDKNFYMEQTTFTPDDMRYNSSWDWLMPVVQRIEELGFITNILTNSVSILINNSVIYKIYTSDGINKIDATYTAVVKFIIWYNQQN